MYPKTKKPKYSYVSYREARSGQSLMEILVAVALAGIFLGGTVMVFSRILSTDKKSREVQTAIDLVSELTDKIKVLASSDWHNLDRLSTSSIITVDAVSAATSSGVSSITFPHAALGENRILVVAVAARDALVFNRTVSGITFGLGNLVRIRSDDAGSSGYEHTELWYLTAPSLGSHNITVNFGGVVDNLTATAVSFNGVDQLNPIDASAGVVSSGQPGNPTLNIGTVADKAMVLDVLMYSNAVNFNPGSGQIELWDTPHAGYPFGSTGSYRGPLSPPQTVSMNHSKSGGGAADWAMSAVSFRLAANIASYNYYIETTSTGLALKNGEEEIVIDGITYTRYYYIENVSRDANGNIEDVYNASNNDPSTRKAIVRVLWGPNSAGFTFHQILTRSKNEIFRQTDWSGGSGQNDFPSLNPNNLFSTSTGINFAVPGVIKVDGY